MHSLPYCCAIPLDLHLLFRYVILGKLKKSLCRTVLYNAGTDNQQLKTLLTIHLVPRLLGWFIGKPKDYLSIWYCDRDLLVLLIQEKVHEAIVKLTCMQGQHHVTSTRWELNSSCRIIIPWNSIRKTFSTFDVFFFCEHKKDWAD